MRLFSFLLIGLLSFQGCSSENEYEPVNYIFLIQFRNNSAGENLEFFSNRADYEYSNLILRNPDGSIILNTLLPLNGENLNEAELEGRTYFNNFISSNKLMFVTPTPSTILLDFGNGDIDTLEITSDPFIRYFNNKVTTLRIFYNGATSLEYPFASNYTEFIDRNQWRKYSDYSEDNPLDPIIFQILKE